jgi:hypothetical protein
VGLWGIFYTMVPLLLVGGLILAGAGLARRDTYDPRRTYVVYLLSTILVSLVVLVGGVTALVGNIGERVVGTGGPQMYMDDGFGMPDQASHSDDFVDRVNTGEAIQAALVAGVALLLLYFHAAKLTEITKETQFSSSLLARTYTAYLYIVCFAAVITAVVAAAVAVYALVRIAVPGSLGSAPDDVERDYAIVDLLRFGALAGLTAWIFKWHWKAAEALRPTSDG